MSNDKYRMSKQQPGDSNSCLKNMLRVTRKILTELWSSSPCPKMREIPKPFWTPPYLNCSICMWKPPQMAMQLHLSPVSVGISWHFFMHANKCSNLRKESYMGYWVDCWLHKAVKWVNNSSWNNWERWTVLLWLLWMNFVFATSLYRIPAPHSLSYHKSSWVYYIWLQRLLQEIFSNLFNYSEFS